VQQPTGHLEGRYGRPGDRPRWPVPAVAAVLATAFLGWVGWAALGAASGGAQAEVTAFRVLSADEIEVRVSAIDDGAGRLGCSLRALDRTREVVGVSTVVLDPARPRRAERWVSVRTRERAVTATIGECSSAAAD